MTPPSDRYLAAIDRLRAEGQTLENIVKDLPAQDWRKATPAPGWTIAHQVAHLAWTDTATLATLEGEETFKPYLETAKDNPLGFVDDTAEQGAQQEVTELLTQWQTGRRQLADAFEKADLQARYTWFGPGMKALSMVTARIMETWAHGQDVANALCVEWPPSDALRDVAHLDVATRKFTYQNNDMEVPESEMYVELTGPSGQIWTWGHAETTNSVKGTARDFAQLVTQRAELEDLDLVITGEDARTWASIAQAFAGPPKSTVRAHRDKTV